MNRCGTDEFNVHTRSKYVCAPVSGCGGCVAACGSSRSRMCPGASGAAAVQPRCRAKATGLCIDVVFLAQTPQAALLLPNNALIKSSARVLMVGTQWCSFEYHFSLKQMAEF